MKTKDFGYDLPNELIAQSPMSDRDMCKMLVLDKATGNIQDKHFFDIYDYLLEGDLLVVNQTRVLPARLIGRKVATDGKAEVLLLKKIVSINNHKERWEALVKPGKRLKPLCLFSSYGADASLNSCKHGPVINFFDNKSNVILSAEIIDWAGDKNSGMRLVELTSDDLSIDSAIHKCGITPLPPYIHGYDGDVEMYQTVYSKNESSAAAPTAGLHFSDTLISKLKKKGVNFAYVDLSIGIDTFKPVTVEDPQDHKIHTELYSISQETIDQIEETKTKGNRVIAVGTTSVRTLESCDMKPHYNEPTSLFILPGYKFKVVDSLITNFHVPESTLMMLVSAFAGHSNIINAYKHAIEKKYRFLSFGDAMFII